MQQQRKPLFTFLLCFLSLYQVFAQAAVKPEVNPMSHLQFLVGKKWIIKDKVQQSSKNINTGEVIFEWALDKRIIKFTYYYYLDSNALRPGIEGTMALNPLLEKVRHFSFSDDGQTTEGYITKSNTKGLTIEYDKFLPDGQQIKSKEVYTITSGNTLEVKHSNWNGSSWQPTSAFIWTRNKNKVAYTPPPKNNSSANKGKKYTFASDEWDVPVTFVNNAQTKGLKFVSYTSNVDVYQHSYSYEVIGGLKVDRLQISKLDLKLELLDKEGKVRFIDSDMTVSPFLTPSYRSGDEIPVKIIKPVENQPLVKITQARLSVKAMTKIAAPEKFTPSKKMTLTWEKNKPGNVDVEIKERLNNITNAYKKGFHSQKLLFEVKNTGKLVLKTVTIRIEWLNKQNQVIFSKKRYINTIINPPILPGQTRLYKGSYYLQKSLVKAPNHYRIIIEEVSL